MHARLLLAVAVVGVATGLAGCQDGNSAAPVTQTVTVSGTSATSAAPATATSAASGALPAGTPDDFPVPPGTEITGRNLGGKRIDLVITGKDAGAVVGFYRSSLPGAGYTITKDTNVGIGTVGVTGVVFTGHGVEGKIALIKNTGGSDTVAITLDPK